MPSTAATIDVDTTAPRVRFDQEMAEMTTRAPSSGTRLVSRVICPHCWDRFPPEDVLWTSQHVDLVGDMLLGAEHQQRFLPSRFTPQGDAIDARNVVCHNLACPNCHLAVPRSMLESEPLFLSILGAPFSGKSYFLAAAMWKLREALSTTFGISFRDADPVANAVLAEAEQQLFLNPDSEQIFLPTDLINKTQEKGAGSMSDTISYGGHTITYPQPYIFSLQLNDRHPNAAKGWDQTLCLYDNAGEHWQPRSDTANNHVTRHLAHSRVLLYLFDPMQDRRFRDAAKKGGPELQLPGVPLGRQETILNEASSRIRRYCGLASNAKIDRPLIMVVPKLDAWGHLLTPLLEEHIPEQPWRMHPNHPVAVLRTKDIERVSVAVKRLMEQYCPETVAAAESLTSRVTYIPMSVLHQGIAKDPVTGAVGIRPGSIRPFWAEVPFLYAIQLAVPSLIARTKPIA